MPRLFAIIENATNELVFASSRYSAVSSFMSAIPNRIRDCFSFVRYDANENWIPSNNEENNEERNI